MRPIDTKWKARPGNFDPLHALQLFQGIGPYDIPVLVPEHGAPDWWLPYDDWRTQTKKGTRKKQDGNSAVHFFMEDYRFEAIWNNPDRTLKQIEEADFLLTPDFSLYVDHPRAIHIWNTYRSRWVGAYWQSLGRRVIPTVCWADPASHSFAFDGIPSGSTVAIANVGIGRDKEAARLFQLGYRAMIERIEPALVLCYAETFPDELASLAPIRLFMPWQMSRLRALDKAQ